MTSNYYNLGYITIEPPENNEDADIWLVWNTSDYYSDNLVEIFRDLSHALDYVEKMLSMKDNWNYAKDILIDGRVVQ